jgi:hypothetical protein
MQSKKAMSVRQSIRIMHFNRGKSITEIDVPNLKLMMGGDS